MGNLQTGAGLLGWTSKSGSGRTGSVGATGSGGGCNLDETEPTSMPEAAAFVVLMVLVLFAIKKMRES